MINVDPMERHKRILTIVSHLGLNKRKRNASMFLLRKPSVARKTFFNQQPQAPQTGTLPDEDIIIQARSRLKPLKLKDQFRSESQLVEEVLHKYDSLKGEDYEENTAYRHIQKSLVKIQEDQIMGNRSSVGEMYYKDRFGSTFNSTPLIQIQSPKIRVQNLFEKQCTNHKLPDQQLALQTVRRKLGSIIHQSRQSAIEFQADVTQYQTLTKHNKLYQQRTATYFQY